MATLKKGKSLQEMRISTGEEDRSQKGKIAQGEEDYARDRNQSIP